jgi:hypothetical protein
VDEIREALDILNGITADSFASHPIGLERVKRLMERALSRYFFAEDDVAALVAPSDIDDEPVGELDD